MLYDYNLGSYWIHSLLNRMTTLVEHYLNNLKNKYKMTVVSQKEVFFIYLFTHKINLFQSNTAFILIRFIHKFSVVLCFLYWIIVIRYISWVFEFNIGVERTTTLQRSEIYWPNVCLILFVPLRIEYFALVDTWSTLQS